MTEIDVFDFNLLRKKLQNRIMGMKNEDELVRNQFLANKIIIRHFDRLIPLLYLKYSGNGGGKPSGPILTPIKLIILHYFSDNLEM